MIHYRRTFLVGAAVLLFAASIFISCYPGDELTVSETDTVITLFDSQTDFSTKLTYAMPDTIVHLVPQGEDDDVSRSYDSTILNGIVEHLDALGFTRVVDPATADVHVLTAATVVDYQGYAYYGWYWDYWYGYPPGWGWYPWYPSGGVAYSYSVGTILIVMTDPDRVDASGERVPPIWSAALNGLSDRATKAQRINHALDQAFAQSQYLGDGK